MKQTSEAAKSQTSSLETLKIRECGFSFRGSFDKPRSLEVVNTTGLADAFLQTFREHNVSAADIVLERRRFPLRLLFLGISLQSSGFYERWRDGGGRHFSPFIDCR